MVDHGMFEQNFIPDYEPSYMQQLEPLQTASFMDHEDGYLNKRFG